MKIHPFKKHYTIKFIFATDGSYITSLYENNFLLAALRGKNLAKEQRAKVVGLEVVDCDCNFFETYSI